MVKTIIRVLFQPIRMPLYPAEIFALCLTCYAIGGIFYTFPSRTTETGWDVSGLISYASMITVAIGLNRLCSHLRIKREREESDETKNNR